MPTSNTNQPDRTTRWREAIRRVGEREKETMRAERGEEEATPRPVDVYQERRTARIKDGRKQHPHGSSTAVKELTKRVIVGGDGREGLARAYRRYKCDSDMLKAHGEKERAKMVRQQFMEEQFLPAVEVVANLTSPDELLNCQSALNSLDQYVMLTGRGDGYTASYLRTAYDGIRGDRAGVSDPTVQDAIMRIKKLVSQDQIRAGYSLAKKTKGQIDSGEHMASDADYELLGRIVAYK